jgi:hypothetical protein
MNNSNTKIRNEFFYDMNYERPIINTYAINKQYNNQDAIQQQYAVVKKPGVKRNSRENKMEFDRETQAFSKVLKNIEIF